MVSCHGQRKENETASHIGRANGSENDGGSTIRRKVLLSQARPAVGVDAIGAAGVFQSGGHATALGSMRPQVALPLIWINQRQL